MSFPRSFKKIDWKAVTNLAIKRNVPIKRRAPRRAEGFDNPAYRQWVKEWPCWICLKKFCEERKLPFVEMAQSKEARAYFYRNKSLFDCGLTEFAHVGFKGMAKRCPDREAMPLGRAHHLHKTAGGSSESHHTLGRKFWEFHGVDREVVFETLHKLYEQETGAIA